MLFVSATIVAIIKKGWKLPTIDPDDYWSVPSAAEQLGKPKSTLYRWVEKNKISYVIIDGVPFIAKTEVKKIKEKVAAETAT